MKVGTRLWPAPLGMKLKRVQIGNNPRYDLADGALHSRTNRIRVLMGGAEAELVVFNRVQGDGSDIEQIAELLLDGDDEQALRDQVRQLLALNAGTLKFLAAKLKRCGSMSGAQVEAVVRVLRK